MRYFMMIGLLTACSTNSVGLEQTIPAPDASADTLAAQPDTFIAAVDTRPSLPCNGACGAGTTCVNNVCVVTVGPEPKTGAEPQQGPEPAGKEPGPEPQMAPEPQQRADGGVIPSPGPEPQMGPEPQQGPEPGPEPQQRSDGGATDTTCGGAGQSCCSGRTCNNGGTCTINGCVITKDGGVETKPDTTPACGGQNQLCCLTAQQATDYAGQGVPLSEIRSMDCPLSAYKNYGCFAVQNSDLTVSRICQPCTGSVCPA